MDHQGSVTSLLMKAKVVASKLGMSKSELAGWISHELDGYAGSGAEVPHYRILATEPVAQTPYHGEIPVRVGHPADENLLKALFEMPFTNPISEIEALVAKSNVSALRVPFPPGLRKLIAELSGQNHPLRYRFGPGQLNAVVEAVRTRTLQWALDLEEGGVIGENFQFTLEEKAAAVTITNNFNNSNVGNVGDVTTGGQVINSQSMTNAVEIDKLAAFLGQLEPALTSLPAEVQKAIAEPVSVLNAEVKSPQPSQSKIRSALTSLKATCEGAAGNLVASGVLALVGPLLGS